MVDVMNLFYEQLSKLESKAALYGLMVEVDRDSYPFRVRFQYSDPAQISLFNGRKTGTLIVTVLPDGSLVDLNLYDVDSKDLSQLVKLSEKTVNVLIHAIAAGQAAPPELEE